MQFRKNYQQTDDLIEHLNINVIQAIQHQSLTLVKYFIDEKASYVNTSYFGSNLLRFAAVLEELHIKGKFKVYFVLFLLRALSELDETS